MTIMIELSYPIKIISKKLEYEFRVQIIFFIKTIYMLVHMHRDGSFMDFIQVIVVKAYSDCIIEVFFGESRLRGLERLRMVSQLLLIGDPCVRKNFDKLFYIYLPWDLGTLSGSVSGIYI